ncbi:unnamed protein product [Amoebophrya sp. A25]|nr:unnamed protein product [Amoebophrya sp. A25]|eukprot:GSA25T00006262001.1
MELGKALTPSSSPLLSAASLTTPSTSSSSSAFVCRLCAGTSKERDGRDCRMCMPVAVVDDAKNKRTAVLDRAHWHEFAELAARSFKCEKTAQKYELLVLLLFHTGSNAIDILRASQQHGHHQGIYLARSKTRQPIALCTLPQSICDKVASWMDTGLKGEEKGHEKPLFPGYCGKQLSTAAVRAAFRRCRGDFPLELDGVLTPNSGRHSIASALRASGNAAKIPVALRHAEHPSSRRYGNGHGMSLSAAMAAATGAPALDAEPAANRGKQLPAQKTRKTKATPKSAKDKAPDKEVFVYCAACACDVARVRTRRVTRNGKQQARLYQMEHLACSAVPDISELPKPGDLRLKGMQTTWKVAWPQVRKWAEQVAGIHTDKAEHCGGKVSAIQRPPIMKESNVKKPGAQKAVENDPSAGKRVAENKPKVKKHVVASRDESAGEQDNGYEKSSCDMKVTLVNLVARFLA